MSQPSQNQQQPQGDQQLLVLPLPEEEIDDEQENQVPRVDAVQVEAAEDALEEASALGRRLTAGPVAGRRGRRRLTEGILPRRRWRPAII